MAEQRDERFETPGVSLLQGIQVSLTVIAADVQREVAIFDEHHGRQEACDAAVAVLEGMDLDEAMMQPGSLDYRVFVHLLEQAHQLVHLRSDLLHRRVFVDSTPSQ